MINIRFGLLTLYICRSPRFSVHLFLSGSLVATKVIDHNDLDVENFVDYQHREAADRSYASGQKRKVS